MSILYGGDCKMLAKIGQFMTLPDSKYKLILLILKKPVAWRERMNWETIISGVLIRHQTRDCVGKFENYYHKQSLWSRRCLVAWHIDMNHHALNRDDGSYLPQEYVHLKILRRLEGRKISSWIHLEEALYLITWTRVATSEQEDTSKNILSITFFRSRQASKRLGCCWWN